MLYIIKEREKLERAVERFREKHPEGGVYRFDADNWEDARARFDELLASSEDLFGLKNLIILQGEGDFSEVEEKQLGESAATVLWYQPEASKKTEFNLFDLADALAARDRGESWLVYQQALRAGVTPEEIYWRAVVWKTKKLLQLGSKKYSNLELRQLSSRLVRMWHDTKREVGRDFGLELERLLLTL